MKKKLIKYKKIKASENTFERNTPRRKFLGLTGVSMERLLALGNFMRFQGSVDLNSNPTRIYRSQKSQAFRALNTNILSSIMACL